MIKEAAEADLVTFINLIHPLSLLGNVHKDIISWWNREDAKTHQLLLLPRDHQKSRLLAYRIVWELTKDPTLRVLYISSTSNLAQKQLRFMKNIFTHPTYRRYWPEMVHEDEGKRDKWTETEISLDHPLRYVEAIRDPSIFTAGLTTTITGLHCDIAALDDVVIKDNAYTEEGREKVRQQYSGLSSIESSDAREWTVGTRYHPNDLYNDQKSMDVELYNEDGSIHSTEPLYEIYEAQVENVGDGTGEFLWPRQQRSDGKWYGFNQSILARKRTQYIDKTQFKAQYYNDPNDRSNSIYDESTFQYYERNFISNRQGRWYFKDKPLNVFAAIDFAWSTSKKADYTAIVVVGVDKDTNYYILDIARFKTFKISEYYSHIFSLFSKWGFKKLRAEVTTAQRVIVEDLKMNYIRKNGLSLSVEDHSPRGNKEERVNATLEPRYANRQIWHYNGGNCQVLEEELLQPHPAHDDVKDCLAACIEFALPPSNFIGRYLGIKNPTKLVSSQHAHSRFGGVN